VFTFFFKTRIDLHVTLVLDKTAINCNDNVFYTTKNIVKYLRTLFVYYVKPSCKLICTYISILLNYIMARNSLTRVTRYQLRFDQFSLRSWNRKKKSEKGLGHRSVTGKNWPLYRYFLSEAKKIFVTWLVCVFYACILISGWRDYYYCTRLTQHSRAKSRSMN